jgi:hypothetical protein
VEETTHRALSPAIAGKISPPSTRGIVVERDLCSQIAEYLGISQRHAWEAFAGEPVKGALEMAQWFAKKKLENDAERMLEPDHPKMYMSEAVITWAKGGVDGDKRKHGIYTTAPHSRQDAVIKGFKPKKGGDVHG